MLWVETINNLSKALIHFIHRQHFLFPGASSFNGLLLRWTFLPPTSHHRHHLRSILLYVGEQNLWGALKIILEMKNTPTAWRLRKKQSIDTQPIQTQHQQPIATAIQPQLINHREPAPINHDRWASNPKKRPTKILENWSPLQSQGGAARGGHQGSEAVKDNCRQNRSKQIGDEQAQSYSRPEKKINRQRQKA